ncbi:MAG: hypothetical protein KDC66_11145 [Phaeodactylibacter sp.]|nr:hypothetical protein [Phaeodactylibacter sp.]MCB9273252.1 hypothetical protein [Lewinellaceae bacterium]
MKKIIYTCLFSFFAFTLGAQDNIVLENPSFEAPPRHSKCPTGWSDCGFPDESPVDIQPSGDFSCTLKARKGDTYVAMIVRDNLTWESIGQQLSNPLMAGQCYELGAFLCRSPFYISLSRATLKTVNYITPAVLRIWGANRLCEKEELLAVSMPIDNTEWKKHNFTFTPSATYSHIILEAYYLEGALEPYNGHILLDGLSAISPCTDIQTTEAPSNYRVSFAQIPETEQELVDYLAKMGLVMSSSTQPNSYMWDNLVEVMQAFPDKQLVIAVGAKSIDTREARLETLKQYYLEKKYGPNLIRIEAYSSASHLEQGWLWEPPNTYTFIMMRLIDQ